MADIICFKEHKLIEKDTCSVVNNNEHVLLSVLEMVESGELNPAQLCVVVVEENDDHLQSFKIVSSDMSARELVSLLDIAKDRAIQECLE
jgi:hypothetical protein